MQNALQKKKGIPRAEFPLAQKSSTQPKSSTLCGPAFFDLICVCQAANGEIPKMGNACIVVRHLMAEAKKEHPGEMDQILGNVQGTKIDVEST